MKQTTLIHRTDWDNLIILDACRFDSFKKAYDAHLRGTLKKAMSPASNTFKWLAKTWPDWYDITYFSANPYINSHGVAVPKTNYIAKDHFKKIVDVWNLGWSDSLGTVHPEAMNDAVLTTPRDGKMIIHYMQPHRPYIGKDNAFTRPGTPLRQKLLSQPMPPKGSHRAPHYHQIKKAYVDTLELVLSYVERLMPNLEGKVVITSDHGELINKDGYHGQHPDIEYPDLREVPWFVVKK